MKLLILYCIASLASMCTFAQQVSVSFANTSFREAARQIEKQIPYTFVYTSEQEQKIPTITIQKDTINIPDLLKIILRKTSIGFLIDGNSIILTSDTERKKPMHGRVITQSGNPVDGATIEIQSEKRSVSTGRDGSFDLPPINPGTVLAITGAEIIPTEIITGNNEFLEIKVQQRIRELDETIILGYGSTTRRFNTGNVVKVNIADLNKMPRNDIFSFMQGKVPGLLITSSGSAPDASSLLQIRGQHSINPNPLLNYLIPPVDQPFIVVNGIPFAPQNNNINQLSSIASPGSLDIYQNPYGGISPFKLIDPADIESIEVLKDAVATSIYGSRSANGVIIITTREPDQEKLSVEAVLSSGITIRKAEPEMLSTEQYREMRKIAFSNDNIQPSLVERSLSYAPDLLSFDSSRQVHWYRNFYHTAAALWNGHIRLSGSIARVFFTSSLSFRNEDHLLKGNFFSKQLTSNQQLRYQSVNKKLTATTSLYYSNATNVSVASPALLRVISLPPNYPELYDLHGKLNWEYNGLPVTDNPAACLLQTYTINMAGVQATSRMEYLIAKGISASVRAGHSSFSTQESSLFPHASFSQQQQRSVRAIYGSGRLTTNVLEPQIEYKWSNGKLSLQVTSGATFQRHSLLLESKRGTGYTEGIKDLALANAARIDQRQISDNNNYRSLLTRVSVRLSERYMLDISGRRENSSHFGQNSKSGNFSSIGAGWIFSNEAVIKQKAAFLNYGKLRISYGTTGTDNIGYNHFHDSWSRIPTYTGNQVGTNSLNEIPFGWSVTRKAEVAIEFHMLDSRLSFTISSYFHSTNKQLISQLLPNQTTVLRYIQNFPAVVRNRGVEFTGAYKSSEKNKLQYFSQLSITANKNYLHKFAELETSLYGRRYWEGFPLEAKQPLRFEGVDPQTGIYRFSEDKSHYVSTAPKLYGGLTQTIGMGRWKAEWQFDFRFQTGVNYLGAIYNLPAGVNINQPIPVASYWRSPGDITQFQKPTTNSSSSAMLASFLIAQSDAIYSNASFLCLRNFYISRSMYIKNRSKPDCCIQLYVQLQNIFTLSGFPVTNPETRTFYSYPGGATITGGVMLRN